MDDMIAAGLARPADENRGVRDFFFNRLMFPITDGRGRTIAFGGRGLTPDAKPKYINTGETEFFSKGRQLYNYATARPAGLKAQTIMAAPGVLVQILLPLAIIYGVNYALSTFLGRTLLPRGDAIAMVYGTVMRNLSIALAVAINAFGAQGSDAALVVALAYIIQVQSAAWYVKLTGRLFGPVPLPAGPHLVPAK
jgi:hypothetical protein